MAPSKLDYLSKYTSSGVVKPGKKSKKKKSKKEKKREESALVHDADDELLFGKSQDANSEEEDEDEDQPIVVPSEELPAAPGEIRSATHRPMGSWKADGVKDESEKDRENTNSTKQETSASPSSGGRRRYDSDSDSQGKIQRRRYDSSDEESVVGHRKRVRHDSPDDETKLNGPPVKKEEPEESLVPPRRSRRRYDSDSDTKSDSESKRKRRSKHAGNSKVKREEDRTSKLRKRYDSSSGNESVDKDRKGSRIKREEVGDDKSSRGQHHESESRRGGVKKEESDSDISRGSRSRRRRYDSDSEESSVRVNHQRRRRDSDSEDSGKEERVRMSSGHVAGLQRADEFTKSEKVLQRNKHKEAQSMVDKYGMGDTVYRDADGRKTDAPPDKKKKRIQMDPDEQRRLNQSDAQRAKAAASEAEFERLQKSGFARYADDDRLEEDLKNTIRADDPMAKYAQKSSRKKAQKNSSAPLRPVYKGPPAKPNRFGILPGYRWDGVDRANGWEDKVLAQKFNKAEQEEKAYRWRSADM